MPGIAFARKVSRTLRRQLVHSYTRTREAPADTENAWGDEDVTAGTATSGLPCLYGSLERQYTETLTDDPSGARTIRVPALFVPPDDVLAVGDVVTSVLDATGAVLLAGPLAVEAVILNAEAGVSVLKAATLRGTTPRALP